MISEAAIVFGSWIGGQAWRRHFIWALLVFCITFIFTIIAFVGARPCYTDCRKGGMLPDNRSIAASAGHGRLLTVKGSEIFESGFWSLGRQERLKRAKIAIENLHLQDELDDLHDDGVLYRNISRFKRSYEAMQRVFRIFVYKDGYKPLMHEGPKTGIYASEGLFIATMERGNPFAVTEPKIATMFFIPFSLKQMVDYMYDTNSHSMKNIQSYIAGYLRRLASKYPYMNATNGIDHFFVSCHDWALMALEKQDCQRNIVKVVCNADSSRGFNTSRDVSLPETRVRQGKHSPIIRDISGMDRPYLAFFAGQMHGKLRPVLLAHWKDKDPEMKIYEVLPPSVAERISYSEHMRLSKYCICAAGFEVNSPRLVEAIVNECVPVILADNFVLPFSEVINWDSISVTVAEKDVANLKAILAGIPLRRYKEMQARLKHVKRHFVWKNSPEKYDIFNMIVHSLWTQQLNNV
ncbi:probable glycosyltransferase At5g25310 [Selaginella moellendorffii]|uniref:probable glycosyltransferase At5g25310 n=1 Tax=Selaginella moellendorffii TaxID=88036 RepID=UPI000D1C5C68|nr:probable glycosyltransferase At5g25310 [Selaginella moellendorffii]|eukprot:XP_002969667.2 probable glycosyltransferase At5g25310 [Selaginella moellendorffii]